MSIQVLHPLLNQVVLFFVVEFLQHLSIFWMLIPYQINNLQSSPHFMGCLFTLLIIYFTLQKLSDLMKWHPHLFIFDFVAYLFDT